MSKPIKVDFTPEDWHRLEKDWAAWWAGDLDRPVTVVTSMEPAPKTPLPEAPGFVTNLSLDMPADEVIDRYQVHLERTRFHADAWPKWWINFGAGIVAGFLGAKVVPRPDTTWFEPSKKLEIGDIKPEFDENNVWWRRVKELTRKAVERWGDKVCVAFTDLGGNLDILASLRTTEGLLLDLYDAPEEVMRVSRKITEIWIRHYNELAEIIKQAGRGTSPWASIWSPQRTYMLQSDFAYMISPEMFERYVLPDLDACCRNMEHGFYHLDGVGQLPHVDMLLSLKSLKGIQWVPGSGSPEGKDWIPLAKKIRDSGKRCQFLSDAEGTLKLVKEIGGRGFTFQPWGVDGKNVDDFLSALAKEDISNK